MHSNGDQMDRGSLNHANDLLRCISPKRYSHVETGVLRKADVGQQMRGKIQDTPIFPPSLLLSPFFFCCKEKSLAIDLCTEEDTFEHHKPWAITCYLACPLMYTRCIMTLSHDSAMKRDIIALTHPCFFRFVAQVIRKFWPCLVSNNKNI